MFQAQRNFAHFTIFVWTWAWMSTSWKRIIFPVALSVHVLMVTFTSAADYPLQCLSLKLILLTDIVKYRCCFPSPGILLPVVQGLEKYIWKCVSPFSMYGCSTSVWHWHIYRQSCGLCDTQPHFNLTKKNTTQYNVMISAVMKHRGTVENGSDHFHLS